MAAEKYEIDHEKDYIRITFMKGIEVHPELILKIIDIENAVYKMKYWHSLWDFRGCLASRSFGYDAIKRIIKFIDSWDHVEWSPKMAFVIDTAVQYGLLRMFQTLCEGYPTEVAIFDDDAAAEAWLGISESTASEAATTSKACGLPFRP